MFQLVEVVLIKSNNNDLNISKELLEKRLAETMNPKNIGKDKSAQLRIIDNFLSEKENKANLREAINLVKPFFFSVC